MTGGGNGSTPVVAHAPGRVNLIGEHTDYNQGFVLPMAIDRGATARLSPAAGPGLTVASAQFPGEVVTLDWADVQPGSVGGWPAYVVGAVWSMLLGTDRRADGLRIDVDCDVPLGAGLSSSAALECAVGLATATWFGLDVPARELARRAQRAENDFVGVPTGAMDQVASAMAEAGSALLFDVQNDTIDLVPVEVEDAGLAFVVIDTQARHELIDGGYANRRASCEQAAAALGVASLREVTDLDDAMRRLDDPVLQARTRHVITENARVVAAAEAMRASDFRAFGRLMDDSHTSMRDDFAISCDELDVAVEAARSAGAWGARMTGGGFGGSAIALVPSERVDPLVSAAEAAFRAHGWAAPRTWAVHPAAGARVVPVGCDRG